MRIRPVEPEEWEALRVLRLEALLESPDAFGSSYEQEESLPAEGWQWWISGEGGSQPGRGTTFVVDDGGFQGMAAGAIFDAEPERAHLYGMWVRPEARERGLGMKLLEAVAAWAQEQGASELELQVAEGNSSAAQLYERVGFTPTGERCPLRECSDLTCIIMMRHLD